MGTFTSRHQAGITQYDFLIFPNSPRLHKAYGLCTRYLHVYLYENKVAV